ncbi:MAG TPA: DUF2059 domain-containing protein [Terriglobales bacterium]|nr:DUF2059 domain-containing protein [Terriglobales bacterium]
MRRIAIILLLVAFLAPVCVAQSADSPSREQVLKLMEVLSVRRQVGVALDGMFHQFSISMAAEMKKMAPNATPEQQKLMDELASGAQQDMRSVMKEDEMIELIVPIYQKYLTKQEVEMITNFYSTPEGQAFLQKMPMVMKDAMQVGGDYGRSKQPELQQLIEKRLADFKEKLKELDATKKPGD